MLYYLNKYLENMKNIAKCTINQVCFFMKSFLFNFTLVFSCFDLITEH